jgi:hypothetical protein
MKAFFSLKAPIRDEFLVATDSTGYKYVYAEASFDNIRRQWFIPGGYGTIIIPDDSVEFVQIIPDESVLPAIPAWVLQL